MFKSIYFGSSLTILAYLLAVQMKKKVKHELANPLLIAIILVIACLSLLKIDYDDYYQGAQMISALLTPATICLAIPLYQQKALLKKHFKAILIGITIGSITSMVSVLGLSYLFKLDAQLTISLLPKSITTAIGSSLVAEYGGIVTITIVTIVLTGIWGSLIYQPVAQLFKIKHPVSQGLALGTSAHAIGTTKALELGESQGAMSSLSIALAGLITVILMPLFAMMV